MQNNTRSSESYKFLNDLQMQVNTIPLNSCALCNSHEELKNPSLLLDILLYFNQDQNLDDQSISTYDKIQVVLVNCFDYRVEQIEQLRNIVADSGNIDYVLMIVYDILKSRLSDDSNYQKKKDTDKENLVYNPQKISGKNDTIQLNIDSNDRQSDTFKFKDSLKMNTKTTINSTKTINVNLQSDERDEPEMLTMNQQQSTFGGTNDLNFNSSPSHKNESVNISRTFDDIDKFDKINFQELEQSRKQSISPDTQEIKHDLNNMQSEHSINKNFNTYHKNNNKNIKIQYSNEDENQTNIMANQDQSNSLKLKEIQLTNNSNSSNIPIKSQSRFESVIKRANQNESESHEQTDHISSLDNNLKNQHSLDSKSSLNKKWSNNITNISISNPNIDLNYLSNNKDTPRAIEPLTPKINVQKINMHLSDHNNAFNTNNLNYINSNQNNSQLREKEQNNQLNPTQNSINFKIQSEPKSLMEENEDQLKNIQANLVTQPEDEVSDQKIYLENRKILDLAKHISNDSTQESDVKKRLEDYNNQSYSKSKMTLDLSNTNYKYNQDQSQINNSNQILNHSNILDDQEKQDNDDIYHRLNVREDDGSINHSQIIKSSNDNTMISPRSTKSKIGRYQKSEKSKSRSITPIRSNVKRSSSYNKLDNSKEKSTKKSKTSNSYMNSTSKRDQLLMTIKREQEQDEIDEKLHNSMINSTDIKSSSKARSKSIKKDKPSSNTNEDNVKLLIHKRDDLLDNIRNIEKEIETAISTLDNDQSNIIGDVKQFITNKYPLIDEDTKHKLISWLEDVNFIKEKSLTPLMLPQVLGNGQFIGKLLNRLESKDDMIKGLESKPKNKSKLRNNWSKIIDQLKSKQKFESEIIQNINNFVDMDNKEEDGVNTTTGILMLLVEIHNYYQPLNKIVAKSNGENKNKPPKIGKMDTKNSIAFLQSRNASTIKKRNNDENVNSVFMGTNDNIRENEDWDNTNAHNTKFRNNTSQNNVSFADAINQFDIKSETNISTKYTPNSQTNIQKRKILNSARLMSPDTNTHDQILVNSIERNLQDGLKAFNPAELDQNAKQIEEQVYTFLEALNINTFKLDHQSKIDIIHDPYRNGSVLNEILTRILKKKQAYQKQPKQIADCECNWDRVFENLSPQKSQIHNKYLEGNKSQLLGQKKQFLGLIQSLQQMFMSRVENNDQIQEYYQANIGLYAPPALARIEKSLIIWLKEVQIIGAKIQKFSQLSESWSGGCILIEIIEKYFNMIVKGTTKKPKTDASKKSNVEKCIEILRKDTKVDRKFLNNTSKIIECDFQYMFGLLEQLHMMWDSQTKPKNSKEPYLPYETLEISNKPNPHNLHINKEELHYNKKEDNKTSSHFKRVYSDNTKLFSGNTDEKQDDLLSEQMLSNDRTLKSINFNTGEVDLRNLQYNTKMTSPLHQMNQTSESTTNINLIEKQQENGAKNKENLNATNDLYLAQKNSKTAEKSEQENISLIQELQEWLRLFEIKINIDEMTGRTLTAFSNGVMLMDIVEKLEKKSQGNWENRPKNRASCLKNIRRVFEILKSKRDMSMKNLVNEEDVLSGDSQVILGLLSDLRHAQSLETNQLKKFTKSRKNKRDRGNSKDNSKFIDENEMNEKDENELNPLMN